jgi:hypothetical protein
MLTQQQIGQPTQADAGAPMGQVLSGGVAVSVPCHAAFQTDCASPQ